VKAEGLKSEPRIRELFFPRNSAPGPFSLANSSGAIE
jgi:hypothetical protein